MVKQRLEGHFRNELLKNNNIWFLKLQVMPMSYTSMPADFLILSEHNKYLVECKECSKKVLVISRLTQIKKMLEFYHKFDNNYAYFLISFWNTNKNNSIYYHIPVDNMWNTINNIDKKSLNMSDFEAYFSKFQVNLNIISNYFI